MNFVGFLKVMMKDMKGRSHENNDLDTNLFLHSCAQINVAIFHIIEKTEV